MRKRFLVLALLLLALPAQSAQRSYSLNAQSVTDTGVIISFVDNGGGSTGIQIVAQYVLIANDDSADEVFCNFRRTTATTADFMIPFGAAVSIQASTTNDEGGILGIGCVASTGETTTIRVLALPR